MHGSKFLNVLDFRRNNGKVRAASRRGVVNIWSASFISSRIQRDLMRSINRVSPSAAGWLPLRAAAGLFLGFLAFQATAKNIGEPKLKSSSVLVVDQSDSSVLYSRNPDIAAPIASITKLMTALVVLDAKQPLDEPIQITEADRDFPKSSFSRLTVGTTLTRG